MRTYNNDFVIDLLIETELMNMLLNTSISNRAYKMNYFHSDNSLSSLNETFSTSAKTS